MAEQHSNGPASRMYVYCVRHARPSSFLRDTLAYAFAAILMIVALHLLDGSTADGRGEERCQHILDIVETYARISGSGKGGDDNDDDGSNDDVDGEGDDLTDLTLTIA